MSPERTVGARRTRRNVVKAAGLLVGTVGAISGVSKRAHAQWWWGGGGGGGGGQCFLRGTRIRTTKGYRAVETLCEGEVLPTRFAGTSSIQRIESFIVDGSDTGPANRPVRVRRGALADGIPAADICVTAAHAILLEGVLVPVGNLVNGTTITFADDPGRHFEFFHIAFDRHDAVDAEGAVCESLLAASMTPCAPIATFNGHLNELKSRLRSATAIVVDRRRPLDIIRDELEERADRIGPAIASGAPAAAAF